MPQPYFVPVSPTTSRIAQSRGILGSASIVWLLPLILSRIAAIRFYLKREGNKFVRGKLYFFVNVDEWEEDARCWLLDASRPVTRIQYQETYKNKI
jgi:hypothetical protein